MKVLIWSPRGVGESYGGPSMNAHRLLGKMKSAATYSLAHGKFDQEKSELFDAQTFVAEMKHFSVLKQLMFVAKGRHWMAGNVRKYDAVLGIEGFHPTVAPLHTAQSLGVPSVVFLAAYKTDLADKKGLPTNLGFPRRRRAMAAQLSGLIVLSTAMEEELLEYKVSPDKIAKIPIGVDTTNFRPVESIHERTRARAEHGLRDLPTIIFVGGVNRRKQPHLLVRAIAALKCRGLDAQLLVVGPEQDEQYSREIREFIREKRIGEQIIWMGFTRDVAPLFRLADVFSLVSRNEGMPSALIEAMATNLPSVVTRISGTSDVIKSEQNGIFVSDDEAEVTNALETYLKEPSIAIAHGTSARKFVDEKLSINRVADAYVKLLKEIVSGRPAANASIL